MRRSTNTIFDIRGSSCFSTLPRCRCPCRAAVVAPDPQLRCRDHPPLPGRNRVGLAQAPPSRAGPAGAGYLRKGDPFAEIAAEFGVSTATAWRYVHETVALLTARAPKLRRALWDAREAGHAYVILNGTLIPIDRLAANRPFYSGKHRRHTMNLQVISSPGEDILRASG